MIPKLFLYMFTFHTLYLNTSISIHNMISNHSIHHQMIIHLTGLIPLEEEDPRLYHSQTDNISLGQVG